MILSILPYVNSTTIWEQALENTWSIVVHKFVFLTEILNCKIFLFLKIEICSKIFRQIFIQIVINMIYQDIFHFNFVWIFQFGTKFPRSNVLIFAKIALFDKIFQK